MINVLITGANSYIGTNVSNWLSKYPDKYNVTTIDMIDGSWKNFDFSNFDTVYHVAGIAHDTGNKKDAQLYYKVNRDLALEVANKAKESNVKQFIFMSSMLVYNGCKERIITKDTKPKVKGCYGDSKLQADLKLQEMNSIDFKVAIIRPPMIFGPGCKGNFPRLAKLAQKMPIFPDFKNERSMLYIDNLCEFIRLLIDSQESGIYFPQNEEYFCTSEIVEILANEYGHKMWFTKLGNWLIYLLKPINGTLNKLFGRLVYEREMSQISGWEYIKKANDECIKSSCM